MNLFDFKLQIRQGKYLIVLFIIEREQNQNILFASNRVRVPSRNGSVKIEMKGIFVGAKVVQGHDWEWGQQDGGKGTKYQTISNRQQF